ncbi:RNase III inhibitor [Listeria floridensis FSL S10-1187]|uniref:RNase III inhibitor n=1 Tax=Listeria floridensis FSL S10-1187 TaxID=1265817 RepID=A0ABP3AXR5_9LIST|nr:O-acetyl-ADP-ribose deacetylase [Listeria floridensis]EUJ31682.1 RNase III inhibitor [Listeria floridensis FSL S10-1187]
MEIKLIKGDITEQAVDAIVNAANPTLLGGGGVDGAIHRKAGPELLEACKKIIERIGSCETGEAVITKGYDLPASYVIHTVGPVWQGGESREANQLASCYFKSLDLAGSKLLASIAFPNISTGVYRFPKELAVDVAVYTVKEWIKAELGNTTLQEIRFVCFDDENYVLYERKLKENNLV